MQRIRIKSALLAAGTIVGMAASVTGTSLHAQGLTYDMKMSMQQGTAASPGDAQILMSGHGKFADGNSRMDMDQSVMPNGFLGKGTYMILKSGSRNEWIVDPDKKQYYEINMDSVANFSMASMNIMGGLVKMETSDATAEMQPMGPGETIQGYTTMKYRVTTNFTSTTSILGRKKRSKNTTTTDVWVAPQLGGLYNPASAASQVGGGSELGRKVAAEYAKMGKGAFIKTVSQTQSTGDHASAMTATMELLNIRRTRVPSSAFDVPTEYTRIDGTAALSMLGGGGTDGKGGNFGDQLVDSARQGAKQGAAEEVKNQAKDKAQGVLRGIFRRP
ncbi:MAG: DUF4412 domain-containing protein [Gemmatimonadota bacterium]|nr:DUF4412 domain-containing protein [Gemmatimonadota bacterium]